jgi:uncharacterized protein YggT (Ycf19 family)
MLKVPRDILSFLMSLLEFLLLARFLLKLLGANEASPIVTWVYQTSEPLLRPFALAFPSATAQRAGILEYNTLFALFVYAFIGYAIEALLTILLSFLTPVEVESATESVPKSKANRSKKNN